jgi:hypothetical protein
MIQVFSLFIAEQPILLITVNNLTLVHSILRAYEV